MVRFLKTNIKPLFAFSRQKKNLFGEKRIIFRTEVDEEALEDLQRAKETGESARETPENSSSERLEETIASSEGAEKIDVSLSSQAEKVSAVFQQWFLKIREIRNGRVSLQGLVEKKIDTITGKTQDLGDGLKRATLEKVGVYRQRALEHKERLLARVKKCNDILPALKQKTTRLEKEYEAATNTAHNISSLRLFKKTKAYVGDKMYALGNYAATKIRTSETAELAGQAEAMVEKIRDDAQAEHQSLHDAIQEKVGNYAEEKNHIYDILGTTEEQKDEVSELIDGCVQRNFLSIRKMNQLLSKNGVSQRAIWGIIEPLQSSWLDNVNAVDFYASQQSSRDELQKAEAKHLLVKRQKDLTQKWNEAKKNGYIVEDSEITLDFDGKTTLSGEWRVVKANEKEVEMKRKNGKEFLLLQKTDFGVVMKKGDDIITRWLKDITFPKIESEFSSRAA